MITDIISADVTGYVLHFVLILFAGYLLALIAKKIKIQPVLPVLLLGIVFMYLNYRYDIINIRYGVVQLISIIAFALAAFEISSKIETKHFDSLSKRSAGFVIVMFFIMITVFSLTSWYMFGINIWHAVILSCLMMSIEFGTIKNTRILSILKAESAISNIIAIAFPLFFIQLGYKLGILVNSADIISAFSNIKPWFIAIIVGLGAGFLVSLISLRIINYYKIKSKFALIIAVLIAFFLSEVLDGSGLIAILVLGFIFGNFYLGHKVRLHNISGFFVNIVEITAVFLAAFLLNLPITINFLIKSLILFIIYLIIRFVSIRIMFGRHKLRIEEELFLSLNTHKGVVFLVVLLFLSTKINLAITSLAIVLMIYSIIASWFAKLIKV